MNFFLERSSYNQYRTVLDEDDSIFFSFNSENGSRIVCKSAEEFKANLLDQDDGIYVVRKKSNIYFDLPDYDCEGCTALPLCQKNDISRITGFIISGLAKKWNQLTEPRYELRKHIEFKVGDGYILTANMFMEHKTIAFTTDSGFVFRVLASKQHPVIYVSNNDFGFHLLSKQLDKNIHKVMIGFNEPKENKHLFVSINEICCKYTSEQTYQYILDQLTLLNAKMDENK